MKRVLAIAVGLLLFASSSAEDVSRWEPAIQRFVAADRENPPPQNAILFAGSSSIVLWRTLAEDMAPLTVINRGFGGSQMFELNMFRDRIVTNYAPRTIVVYEGDNDLWAGKSEDAIVQEFEDFVRHIGASLPETQVCFIAIKPSLSRAHLLAQQHATNARIRVLTESNPKLCYFDVVTPMMDGDKIRPELFVADGLHMNAAGYEIWTNVIRPELLKRSAEYSE